MHAKRIEEVFECASQLKASIVCSKMGTIKSNVGTKHYVTSERSVKRSVLYDALLLFSEVRGDLIIERVHIPA